MERTTGTYRTVTTVGEVVRTFVPVPLPPDPPLEISGGRQLLLERATIALGRLDSIGMLLPDPHLFLYSYVRREAVLSSQIEGTQSSLSDLMLYELDGAPGVVDDVVEVSNYVSALTHGMDRLRGGFPLSNRLICEMHGKLMDGGRGGERLAGEFRRSQNWIGGSRPGNAHYVPPPPDEVGACMGALETFLHEETSGLPVLIRAGLAHVQFKSIHPFLDGNGRLGRLLIALLLHKGNILSEPLLYLSLYFKQHRVTYYDLLDRVRRDGDWEAWTDFFLEGVEYTASGAVETASRLTKLFAADVQRVQATGRKASNALRVLDVFRRGPVQTLTNLAAALDLTFPTVTAMVLVLQDLGVVTELTGRPRNRVFVYDHYMRILNEGAEPL